MIFCTFSKELQNRFRDPSTPHLFGQEHGMTGWAFVKKLSAVSDTSPTTEISSTGPLWELDLPEAAPASNHFLDVWKENFLLVWWHLWLKETTRDMFSKALNHCFVPWGTKTPKTLKLFKYNKNKKAPAFATRAILCLCIWKLKQDP